MKKIIMTLSTAIMLTATIGCKSAGSGSNTAVSADDSATAMPMFSTDSAMTYLKAQTDMGPRVPGSEAHRACGDYLVEKLSHFNPDTIIEQQVEVAAWNGDRLPLRNILARFNTSAQGSPVLLLAHWDSRPWADAETDPAKIKHPIDGANDGASGVAVLLEIARMAAAHGTLMPLDILLVDGEDYGAPEENGGEESSWCLGTQEWLKSNPYDHRPLPRYAILLDMVGGQGAQFHREAVSNAYAPAIVDVVWNTAAGLGLGDRFVNQPGGAVIDDHLFLNKAGIPAIDIIENRNGATGSFNPTWHTLNDTYDNIDPAAIGDTGRLVAYLTIKR